jgi:hypothetical protein
MQPIFAVAAFLVGELSVLEVLVAMGPVGVLIGVLLLWRYIKKSSN